ncbi:aspartate aminotransferase family protein [Schinkia azotoformans]|uniref:Aminotransferase n=1 Tax=Schinkia azotoformans LMG 9581 TaxID=1131731 RepID=K6E4K8_SCHAZ|nr:aspartate aminotransferase family protein [Schinkia azotoformans]EKN68181.1 aminotransferase [Schinkia azotoformans LMG 9581]MEC1639656.1 aspartate aminotransferase family protein [Schinkia azotoformans]MEC1722461.1 aspartate aminotransferase family protein [Schinkia azotoformans]MEC1946956.1 aspartate aminotransferase family protein [Schinkia azotoformans]MED4414835.1 aspartate aminotransferase family protein [Schinkia azotoformans]
MTKKQVDIQRLEELDKKHFLHPTTSIKEQQEAGPAFIFQTGKGIYLEDMKGTTLIDGMSSLWNVNVGHGREELADAAKEQMAKLAFTSCFSTFSNEPAILLAKKITDLAPAPLTAVFFTSGGSEANDTAYKLARHYWLLKGQPERKKIISRTKSYHGVSMGATSATGLQGFREFTKSLAPDFHFVDHFDTGALRRLIEAEGPETIAAIIAEPVQGAGGVHVAPKDYFKEVKDICTQYGILLITDEVITGFGRTGKWFGMEHYGVIPDMMCFAKGITSGYVQLGGVMISEQIHNDLKELSSGTLLHGYTYSGHAMACAVGLKNIELIEKENLVENARARGEQLLKSLEWIKSERKIVSAVRGLGLMAALDFVDQNQQPFQPPVSPFIFKEAAKLGLICRAVTLNAQDTIVLAPPLIISKEETEKIIHILKEAIKTVELNYYN